MLRKTIALCAFAVLATASLATVPTALAGPLEPSPPEATTILERRLVTDRDGERWETRVRAPFEARFESTKPTGVDAAFQLVVEPNSLDAVQLAKAGERIVASYAEPARATESVATGPQPEVQAAAARGDRPVVARAKPKTRVAHRQARNGGFFGGFFGSFFGSF